MSIFSGKVREDIINGADFFGLGGLAFFSSKEVNNYTTSIYNRLLLNILYVINQKYGLNL